MDISTAANMNEMSYRELQVLAKTHGVKANGKREELVQRLQHQMASRQDEDHVGAEPTSMTLTASLSSPQERKAKGFSAVFKAYKSPSGSTRKVLGNISINTQAAGINTGKGVKSAAISKQALASGRRQEPSASKYATEIRPVAFALARKKCSSHAKSVDSEQVHGPKEGARPTQSSTPVEAEAVKILYLNDEKCGSSTGDCKLDSQGSSHGVGNHDGIPAEVNCRIGAVPVSSSTGAGADDNESPVVCIEDITAANAAADVASATAVAATPRLVATKYVAPSAACVRLFVEEPAGPVDNHDDTGAEGLNEFTEEVEDDDDSWIDARASVSSMNGGKQQHNNTEDEEFTEKYSEHAAENFECEDSLSPASSLGGKEDTRNLVAGSGYLRFKDQAETGVVCTLAGKEIMADYMEILRYMGSNEVQKLLAERENGTKERPEKEVKKKIREKAVVCRSGIDRCTGGVVNRREKLTLSPSLSSTDEETRNLVVGSEILEFTEGDKRVVCTSTGQEIIPEYFEILKYVGSKRVQRLVKEGGPFNVEEFAGNFIVEDPVETGMVHCELTGASLSKSRRQVLKHLNGQLYKLALEAVNSAK